MGNINIGVGAKTVGLAEMYDSSGKPEGAGFGPKLAGIFSGPNLSVMVGGASGDLEKLMETLKLESDESRAKQVLAIFQAAIAGIVAKDAAAAAKALVLEAQTQAIENLIESMKPTKEELEAARRRKQNVENSLKQKAQNLEGLKADLAEKEALISTLDATKDAAMIAKLTEECEGLKSSIKSLDDEIKKGQQEFADLDAKIKDLEQNLAKTESKVNQLIREVEAGIRSLANAAKASDDVVGLTKKEARLGVQESVDPVKEKEERDEELKKLGMLTDVFQVWAQYVQGVKEEDLEIGPYLRGLMDEIDTNKNNLV